MLFGFEEQTAKLTEKELVWAEEMAPAFSKRVGEDAAITSNEIIEAYARKGVKISGSRLRKIVNYLGNSGKVKRLVASSKGYYIENDQAKLKLYRDSLLERARAIVTMANSLKNHDTEYEYSINPIQETRSRAQA